MRSILLGIFFLLVSFGVYGQCTVNVEFSGSPNGGEFTFEADTIGTNLVGPLQYLWSTSTGGSSNSPNPIFFFPNEGIYTVCVEIMDAQNGECTGCADVVVTTLPELWPGDATTNGIANNVDILYYGFAFGFQGPPRLDPSSEWLPQEFVEWPFELPNGLNVGYCDFDGNGIINELDLLVSFTNYGLSTPNPTVDTFDLGIIGEDIPIGFIFNEPGIPEDSIEVSIPIFLGDSDLPASDFNGIAFSVLYDTMYINPSSLSVDLVDSWVNSDGQDDVLTFFRADPNQPGKFDVAITRKNLEAVSGSGPFAELSIILEENVWDLTVSTDLEITNVKFIKDDFSEETVFAYSLTLDFLMTSIDGISDETIQIFPNPFQGRFQIQNSQDIQDVQIFDAQGRLVWYRNQLPTGNHEVNWNNKQSGLFILRYEKEGQVYYQKMISNY